MALTTRVTEDPDNSTIDTHLMAPEQRTPRPVGITLLGFFLILATGILFASAVTLLAPGTALDAIWAVKPGAYEDMLPHRMAAGTGFLAFGLVMAMAAWGWWGRRRWAWMLVLVIFMLNGASDLVRLMRGEVFEGAFGVIMVALLIAYVRSARVRAWFAEARAGTA